MTAAEFKRKWARFTGKESAAYSEHFTDLCHLLGQPTPAAADPSGSDFFCFQKRVVKDAELFDLAAPDAAEPNERGFADVWKKGCFAWEYKGKKKNLDEAYKQLLRYRESLLNPPLLVVCDFDRYIVRTNFNGTVQETHEFTNEQIDRPENIRLLRALFEDPDFLKPQRTTAQVTEAMAAADRAKSPGSLQKRESVELADTATRAGSPRRAEEESPHRPFSKSHRLLLLRGRYRLAAAEASFGEILTRPIHDPHISRRPWKNFSASWPKAALFGHHKIRHFNGHLFEDSTVFELTEDEISGSRTPPKRTGNSLSRASWAPFSSAASIPINGPHSARNTPARKTFLRSLNRCSWLRSAANGRRSNLTSQPRSSNGKGTPRDSANASRPSSKSSATMTVLDPACGSGNFLYVSLQLLLDLEKEVITFATQLGFRFDAGSERPTTPRH